MGQKVPDPADGDRSGVDRLPDLYEENREALLSDFRVNEAAGKQLGAFARFELRSEETKDEDSELTPEESAEYLSAHGYTEVEQTATLHHGGDMVEELRRARRELEHRLYAPRRVVRPPRARRPRCRATRPRRSHVRSRCRTSRAGPSDDDGGGDGDGAEPQSGDGPADANGGAR